MEPERSSLATLSIAGVVYVLVAIACKTFLTGDAGLDARGSLIGWNDVPERALQVAKLVEIVVFRAEPTVSVPIKLGVLVCLLAGLAVSAVRSVRTSSIWALAWLAMLSLSLLLLAVSKVWWPVPRPMYATVFASGVMLVVMFSFDARRLERMASVILLASALAAAMKSNQIPSISNA